MLRRNLPILAALAIPLGAPAHAEELDCTTFLIGNWEGSHDEPGVYQAHLYITFGADGSFSAEKSELIGRSQASVDMPVGTWQAGPAATARTCQIMFTNGRSGESSTEWAEVLGPNSYATGRGSTTMVMNRKP